MQRKDMFLEDLYNWCWEWLENEIEMSGMEAGFLAEAIKSDAEKRIKQWEEQ